MCSLAAALARALRARCDREEGAGVFALPAAGSSDVVLYS